VRPESRRGRGTSVLPLKVLFVINSLEIGGAEMQLAELLRGINREHFHPVVCCLGSRGPVADMLQRAAVRVEFIGLPRVRHSHAGDAVDIIARLSRFVRLVHRERPHIAVGLLYWAYVITTFAASALHVPVIVSTRLSLGLYKEKRPLLRAIERLANRLTDVIIANAEAVKTDAMRQEGLSPDRIVVIHNGVDVSRFRTDIDRAARERLGLGGAQPVVGVVANLLPYKGHRVFLDAWASVVARHPRAAAIFVGDGPLRAELEAMVRASAAPDSIVFLGTRRDVADVLSAVDLVAHPALEEGSANAILEAMAAGRPVVATAVGGNVEAVTDRATGLLVPPSDPASLANAICWLLEHPAEAAAFGRAARHRAATAYGMDDMIRAYERVFLDAWSRVTDARTMASGAA